MSSLQPPEWTPKTPCLQSAWPMTTVLGLGADWGPQEAADRDGSNTRGAGARHLVFQQRPGEKTEVGARERKEGRPVRLFHIQGFQSLSV